MLSAFIVSAVILSLIVGLFIVVRQRAQLPRDPRLDTAFDRAQFARAVHRETW